MEQSNEAKKLKKNKNIEIQIDQKCGKKKNPLWPFLYRVSVFVAWSSLLENTVTHSIIFKATSDDERSDQYYWISDTGNQMWLSVWW